MLIFVTVSIMKRITAILLAFYFTVAAVGIRYDMHYCMGNPVGITMAEESCCGVKTESDDCCKTETVEYKIEDSFIINSISTNLKTTVLELPAALSPYVIAATKTVLLANTHPINAPPFEGPPLTKLYCTYLI